MKKALFRSKVVIKLNGQTIFDTHPAEWDKSYVFKDFQGFERIYFVSDKCEPMGNDYEGFIKRRNFGYGQTIRNEPVESFPKYSKGQLVMMRYHQKWPHLHKEVGIIVSVSDYDTLERMGSMFFYEVLIGDEKITVLERYLDGTECTEEESE